MGEQRKKSSYGKGRKRWLALLLCISMMATSVPVSAGAEEVENSFCYEAAEQETVKTVSNWQWIDENEILDEETGNLGLPGASKRTPAYFDDVVSLLPTQIEAVIAQEATVPQETQPQGTEAETTVPQGIEAETTAPQETETLTISEWICENYPEEGAYEGTYVFTASLEEGYVLSESAKPLTVMVELGGAAMMMAYPPIDQTLQPGSTLDVAKIAPNNFNSQRYIMSTEGADYRITGSNWYETCARFCITESCTVILENISLKTGVTFEEDGETYYNSGAQAIFSIADNVDVTFILKGKSKITNGGTYDPNAHIEINGMMLGEGSSATIAGDGSLDLGGMISRPFGCTQNARLIMKSGLLVVEGFGNLKYNTSTGKVEWENGMIEIVYEGGSFLSTAENKVLEGNSLYDDFCARSCRGDKCRVAIDGRNYQNLTRMIYIKKGADATFSKLCPTNYYTIYLWHKWKQAGEVIDYYVMSDRPDGGEYCHFQHICNSKASNDYLTEAVEIQDKNSIGGAGGKVMSQEVPVENATVTFKSSFFTGSCTTDSDGAYYKAMPPGTYQVLVTAENNTYDLGSITIISETLHTFSFNLARVNGSVKTGNETAANVTLTFQNESSNVTVKTDEDGNYALPMTLGTYQVSAKLPGSNTVYALGTVSIVQADSYTCDYALFKLQGVVKDSSGKGIMKAQVSVESKGKTFETVTDANGSYTLFFAPEDLTIGESFQIKAAYLLAGEKQETVSCDDLGMTKDFALDYADASKIEVYSEDDLVLIAENADGSWLNGKKIELMKDITLTGKFQGINAHATINGLTFNGNDHEIENMTTPLFLNGDAVSLSGSSVNNLHLKGNIVNVQKYLGAIAGYSSGSTFYKCTFEGKIQSTAANGYIGGLVGYQKEGGRINHCGVRLTELAGGCDSYIGGLAGRLDTNLSLLNSYAVIEAFNGTTSSSSGTRTARGALVGKFLFKNTGMVVRNCYAVVKGGNAPIYRMIGYETSWENCCIDRVTFERNYAYAPDGVFENDETSVNHAAALPDAVMKAAPGTTVGEETALIDRLKETTSSFLDWYQDSDGYPSLAPHRCTITYSGGAKGTGSQDSEKVILGKDVILPGAVYKNTDYIQTGWATSENGSKAYGLNDVITAEKNMTLYPYWQLKEPAPCTAPEGLTAVYGQLLREIALPEGFSWNEPDVSVGDVGTRSFTATYTPTSSEAENYLPNDNVQISVIVNKAPSVYLLPVSKVENLTYNQAEQRLVTGGSTVCGTIVYSLSEEGEYKENIPTGKEVNDYTVYYRILGDSNHTDSAVGSILTSIGRCDLSGAEITLGTALTYTGDEQTQNIAEVKVGEQILTAEDYTVTGNTATMAGLYTLTITGRGNYTGSATKQFEIAKISQADPNIGQVTVTPDSVKDTTDVSEVTINRVNTTIPGKLELDADALSYGNDKEYTWTFTPTDTNNYKTVTGSVTISVQDTIAPKAEYRIGENEWKKFINTISLGLFCKDYKMVEIFSSDDNGNGKEGSGVASIQYYISDSELGETAISEVEWKNYAGKIALDAQGVYFIYVKVTDNYGNCATLNSEGIVIYEESTIYPQSMNYTYKESKALEIQITTNGNTFGKLTDGEGTLLDAQSYAFDVATGKLILKAAYLDTLGKGEYSYQIHMKPQGQTTSDVSLVYTFVVNVRNQEHTVTEAESKNNDEIGSEVNTGKDTSDSVITTSPTEVSVEGKTAIVKVKAANIEESVKQAVENKSSEIVFQVAQKDTEKADSILCKLAKKDVSKIIEKTNAEIVISTSAGDVQLSQKTMEKVIDAVQGDNFTINITKVTEPTAEQKQAAGSHASIVDVTIESAGKEITSFGGNKLTIKLEIPDSLLGKTVAVICIAEEGKNERMPGKRIRKGDKEYYEFTTEHLSTFALIDAAQIEKETNAEKNHKKGTMFTTKTTKMVYKVTKAGSTGGTVQFAGTKNKAAKTIRIPTTVTFEGITYKVTSFAAGALKNNKTVTKVIIGKNVATIGTKAFSGCSRLKTIKIESTKLTGKSLSELSLKGISNEVVFVVPKKKIKTYKALFTKAGLDKKVKVTKG